MRNFTTDSESTTPPSYSCSVVTFALSGTVNEFYHLQHASATVLKAVCDSNGKPPNIPPRGTENNEPIDAKFSKGDNAGQGTNHAKYHGRRFSGAGSAYGQIITCLVVFLNVFFLQWIYRIHATAVVRKSTPTTLDRVQGSAFWGSQVLHLVFGGHRPKRISNFDPQHGRSHLKLKCLITFKRLEIDKKLQKNVNRKADLPFGIRHKN